MVKPMKDKTYSILFYDNFGKCMSSYYNLPEILIKKFIKKRYVVFVDTDPFKEYHIIHFEKFEDKLKTIYKMYILYACDI